MGGEVTFARSSSRQSGRTSAASGAKSGNLSGALSGAMDESDSNLSMFSIRSRSRTNSRSRSRSPARSRSPTRSRSGSGLGVRTEPEAGPSHPSSWRVQKKRRRPAPYRGTQRISLVSSDEGTVASKTSRRVSPSSTAAMEETSLARAKEAVAQAGRATDLELDHEESTVVLIRAAEEARIARRAPDLLGRSGLDTITDEAGARTAQAIETDVRNALGVIRHVAKVPRGLKGTFMKSLNDSVSIISDAFEVLRGRTESEEIRRLEAANRRLEAEMSQMKKEMASLRTEFARPRLVPASRSSMPKPPPPPPPPPTSSSSVVGGRFKDQDELLRHLTLSLGAMMDAKLAALDDRLLPERRIRPPLAVDARRANTQQTPASGRGQANRPPVDSPVDFPPLPAKRRQGGVELKSTTSTPKEPTRAGTSTSEPPPGLNEGWSVVARKAKKKPPAKQSGTGKAAQPRTKPKPPKPSANQGPRMRVPNTTAVILTLQPAAVEKGTSYADIMQKAKANIKLGELGIPGVKLKTARTGARMLLLPGKDSGEKADALAARLKEVLPEEEVKVSRPEKCFNVRVSGLDDFTTVEEVVAAVARVTDVAAGRINSSVIRLGPDRLGYVILACPVAAAIKLKDRKRVMVGWASADIKILPSRSERCWRCLVAGHVACACSSSVDRSKDCYRCGQPGHPAATCLNAPHCSICSAGNLNHCAAAQDLLVQSLAQWGIQLAVVAEPYYVPPRSDWAGDLDGSVAIIVRTAAACPPLADVVKGRGYVAATIGEIVVLGGYFSPNRRLADFEGWIEEVGTVVARSRPRPVLVLGDLNAKSVAWGSPRTCARGEALEEWVIEKGLVVLNRGSVHTCVRQQGGSIVDVSFASPELARRVQDWRVVTGVETLSDHRYIRFSVSARNPDPPSREPPVGDCPRWALKKLNREAFKEALIVATWASGPEVNPPDVNVEQEAENLRSLVTGVCDAAMPRRGRFRPFRKVYWWSPVLEGLRRACNSAHRQYTRHRRRLRRAADAAAVEAQLYEGYRSARKNLRVAIRDAKNAAWGELLESLNQDPWGRPFKMARNKLRAWAPPLTESLPRNVVRDVVGALFPARAEHVPPAMAPPEAEPSADRDPVPTVDRVELGVAMLRLKAKNAAPGLDGIPGRAWVLSYDALEPRLMRLFGACLEQGQFPQRWKTGKLVLLRKEGRPADSPSAYRPIVLLDEVGKLFERIIVDRLVQHLSTTGPDLADNQFGFRTGCSTIDAVMRLRGLAEEAVAQGEVLLAVSLDIANAFNSLPWPCIMEALRYFGVPSYLRHIVGDYLNERAVIYPVHEGWNRRAMVCGVPQGSVLGPLLWNIAYDWTLRSRVLPGVSIICYADDTLIAARGRTHRQACLLGTAGVSLVVGRIRRLGLEVALQKTEAVFFHGPRNRPPPDTAIIVGGIRIGIGETMKYLGLVLDSRWDFSAHFRQLLPRLKGAAGALSRLLPNVGGPNATCRKLFEGIVRSMALYGAPYSGRANFPRSFMEESWVRFVSEVEYSLDYACVRGNIQRTTLEPIPDTQTIKQPLTQLRYMGSPGPLTVKYNSKVFDLITDRDKLPIKEKTWHTDPVNFTQYPFSQDSQEVLQPFSSFSETNEQQLIFIYIVIFFYCRRSADRQTAHLMESDYHRLWTFATAKLLQIRCCSLKGNWNLSPLTTGRPAAGNCILSPFLHGYFFFYEMHVLRNTFYVVNTRENVEQQMQYKVHLNVLYVYLHTMFMHIR
ncbi:hypothetical protein K1T71_009015 [Dendrolimus kikuchii]|uniref:Uncharacterized protein n=1 Tax=Dendrolimus kikuchii TaxID=765133 RepID=A0ACC1CW78_9NEOP|nr:hypothetical protein K1T71_009015 [Dendrolimus kikuchii]